MPMKNSQSDRVSVRDLSRIALCAAMIAVCAWITIPAAIPFTMQTFGVFLSLMLLGGKRGTAAIAVYVFMGCIGIPVFSGFRGGPSVLFGATGGYILGFLSSGLIFWLLTSIFGKTPLVQRLALFAGLLACYLFGTLWYMLIYSRDGSMDLAALLAACVVPYILPDGIKMFLAILLARKLKRLEA